MIEVIKHGKKKFRAVCNTCGCEFTYELSDMHPIGGIDCPDCGHYVSHARQDCINTTPTFVEKEQATRTCTLNLDNTNVCTRFNSITQ